MKRKIAGIQKSTTYFPNISGINGWLKNQFLCFLTLLRIIILGYPFQAIKCEGLSLLTYILIYPITRFTLGRERSYAMCESFLITRCTSKFLPLPPPLKSKIWVPLGKLNYGPYLEIYNRDVYRTKMISAGMNIIDVGAHIGFYTILAAEKVGKKGKVIAIEPELKNYEQLLSNIRLNNFQNVIPKRLALANYKGSSKLYISPLSMAHSLYKRDGEIYLKASKVLVNTIDNLLKELALKKIDVLKIDAEGAEMSILKGADRTLKDNPNMKIIIASYHYPSEIKEVYQFLNERGFKTKVFPGGIVMTI